MNRLSSFPDESVVGYASFSSIAWVLNNYGHQGVHAYQLGMSTAIDAALIELARQKNYVIITADLDFSRLLVLSMATGPGLILFRGGNYSDTEMCDLLERVLKEVAVDILENSICVVDQKRIRITQLPIIRQMKVPLCRRCA